MKIVINTCFGGFGVSKEVYDELGWEWNGYGCPSNEKCGIESDNYFEFRTYQPLIEAIEKIGLKNASGEMSDLRIVDLPDGIHFDIDNYDGAESIHETHRSWR